MPDINPILDAIDGALTDFSVSGDAMRWTPEPEPAEPLQATGVWFAPLGTPAPVATPQEANHVAIRYILERYGSLEPYQAGGRLPTLARCDEMVLQDGPAHGRRIPLRGASPPPYHDVAIMPEIELTWEDYSNPVTIAPSYTLHRYVRVGSTWTYVYAPA